MSVEQDLSDAVGDVVTLRRSSARADDVAGAVDEVTWVDVMHDSDVEYLVRRLASLDPRITSELVDDLLTRDAVPRVEDVAGVRHVSAVGMVARQGAGGGCELAFQMVEVLVTPRLLVTCWQQSEIRDGVSPGRDGDVLMRDGLRHLVLDAWENGRCRNGPDLATQLFAGLTTGYKAAYRALDRWIQDWELDFHSADRVDTHSRRSLKGLLGLTTEARRRLAAFNDSRAATPGVGWFDGLTADRLDEDADDPLDKALARLRQMFEHLRADVELVAMEQMVAHADAAKLHEDAERLLQKRLGIVTALFIFPSFVAGLFGANTRLPGGGSWMGFDLMVTIMVVGAVVLLFVVRRWSKPVMGHPHR